MDCKVLINRNIINILIGDEKVYEGYGLPYLSGPDLCTLSTEFGLVKTYSWSGGGVSRWMYMRELMEYLEKQGRLLELFPRLFNKQYFKELSNLSSPELVTSIYNSIVDCAIKRINVYLMLAEKELRVHKGQFMLTDVGIEPVFTAPKVKVVDRQYIRELPERIKDDLEHKDYDSVITKSRTLLEEVLIFIIERLTKERYKSNGDLIKIYQEATDLLNMRQKGDWDKRINELLGGMHKVVSAIASMRNLNSDAHGAGAGRINIQEREAILAANSSMMLAEYWLAVYETKVSKNR